MNKNIYIYILVAWQGHRGDQKEKKKLSKIHLKALNPRLPPGHYNM